MSEYPFLRLLEVKVTGIVCSFDIYLKYIDKSLKYQTNVSKPPISSLRITLSFGRNLCLYLHMNLWINYS